MCQADVSRTKEDKTELLPFTIAHRTRRHGACKCYRKIGNRALLLFFVLIALFFSLLGSFVVCQLVLSLIVMPKTDEINWLINTDLFSCSLAQLLCL